MTDSSSAIYLTSTDSQHRHFETAANSHDHAARLCVEGYGLGDGIRIKVLSKDIISTDWDLGIGTHYEIRNGRPVQIGRHDGNAGEEDASLPPSKN